MLLGWLKVLVGVVLMLNFSVPMVAILKDPGLREEPMPRLVLNLALAGFGQGVAAFSIGTFDVVSSEDTLQPVCVSLQYLAGGTILTIKVATFFLAVDQFVAVVHPLRHLTVMEEWMPDMLLITWWCIPTMILFGFGCHQLGLETSQEFHQRVFGAQGSVEGCHWMEAAFVVTVFGEVIVFLMVTASAALFVYTATKGFHQERRDNLHGQADQTSYFFLRFNSFKRIVKVLLTVLTLDILCTVARTASRWEPQGTLTQMVFLLRLLLIVVEGWTYGLSHQSVRNAIKKLFGIRSGRENVQESPTVTIRPRENGNELPERDIELALRF